jgi:hypothetical protein
MLHNTSIFDTKNCFGPSAFSAEGFMGYDTRSLKEIITDDAAQINELGSSISSIVQALRALYDTAEKALETPVQISPSITAIHYDTRGTIPSPIPGDGTYSKGETHITDTTNGMTIVVTPLSLHLIEAFGFFQGKGSPYRVEPDRAITIIKKISK